MTNYSYYRKCAFCADGGSSLIKYSTRRYAHAECLLRVKGAAFIDTLPACPREQAKAALRQPTPCQQPQANAAPSCFQPTQSAIDAIPDMVRALREVVGSAWKGAGSRNAVVGSDWLPVDCSVIDAARDALKKAEGDDYAVVGSDWLPVDCSVIDAARDALKKAEGDDYAAILRTFTRCVERHDLTYSYSDDHSYWQAGERQRAEIVALAKLLRRDDVVRIWNENVDRKIAVGARTEFYWGA